MTRWFLALLLVALIPAAAGAQTPPPEPILRATIAPPRVVVGQATTLRIDVLAPNYMTAPPELPGFQIRNAATRQLQSVNIDEQRDGASYAGVRFEFAIYPQEPGSYAIAGQKITIHYAAEPPATRDAELALPRIAFAASIPDAAATLRPFVAATKLTIEQSVQRSSDQLKTGDSVTRTITIKAQGTPAMLLPPHVFAHIDGLALYAGQPSLTDHVEGRTDVLTSARVDSATYMLQQPGDYLLPAIDVSWWDVGAQKIENAHLDAVTLQVAINPNLPGSAAEQRSRWGWDGIIDFAWDHMPLAMIAAIILAAAAWAAPRATRALVAERRRRREAWLQSEACAFQQLRRAATGRDAGVTYFALLNWLQRFKTVAPVDSVDALKAAARDPQFDREIDAIEQQLFAENAGADRWSPHQFTRRVGVARRALRRQAEQTRTTRPLPQRLNPIGEPSGPDRQRRLAAR
jgi:hypothetical protein